VFTKEHPLSRWNRALIAVIVFNIIGLLNELFQNRLANRSLFTFVRDSIKDLKMNLLGAAFFLAGLLWRMAWLKNVEK